MPIAVVPNRRSPATVQRVAEVAKAADFFQETHATPSGARGIANRWTPNLVLRGWTPVATAFLDYYSALGITPGEAMFIVHLMSFKRDGRMPYPSFFTISQKMGVTPSAARGYARRLENRGLITRIGRSGQTSQFDLTPLFQKLEELVSLRKGEEDV